MVSTAKIDRLTAFITEYRFWRHIRRHHEIRALEDYVALELKGLKAKAAMVRATLDDVGLAYDELTSSGKLHASEVRGLVTDLGGMKDDLSFAIGTVGNSSGVTGLAEPVEPPKPTPAVLPPNLPNPPEQPPAAPQPIILDGAPSMGDFSQPPKTHPASFGGPPSVQLIRS